MVKALVQLDVRLAVVVGLVLLTVCLAVGFVFIARGIWKQHKAWVSRTKRQLERDAAALVERLFRRD